MQCCKHTDGTNTIRATPILFLSPEMDIDNSWLHISLLNWKCKWEKWVKQEGWDSFRSAVRSTRIRTYRVKEKDMIMWSKKINTRKTHVFATCRNKWYFLSCGTLKMVVRFSCQRQGNLQLGIGTRFMIALLLCWLSNCNCTWYRQCWYVATEASSKILADDHTNWPIPGLILNLTTFGDLTDINFIGCSVQCRCRSIAEISCKGKRRGKLPQVREEKEK